MSNATEVLAYVQWYADNPVPQRNSPGIVVASVLCSLAGSITTLALLGARTSNHGWRNRILLLLAATSMSGVSIFSMHFIAIHFSLVASPQVSWRLQLAPAFVATSFLVPLLVTAIAFVFLGSQSKLRAARCVLTGIVSGAVIVLMHLSASFRLPEFRIEYSAVKLVCSGIIAMAGCSASFLFFFHARSHWSDTLLKRFGFACVLTGAATGMHYLASSGTRYYTRQDVDPAVFLNTASDTAYLVLVGVLVSLYCGSSLAYVSLTAHLRRRAAASQGQLKLVAVIFAADGSVMTTAEGALPTRSINVRATPAQLVRHIAHDQPAFLSTQLLDWPLVDDIMPQLALSYRRQRTSVFEASEEPADEARLIGSFKGRFLEAAYALSRDLDLPLVKLGSLFDRAVPIADRAVAEGKPGRERGVLLVLVTRLSDSGPHCPARLRASGYRFTEPKLVLAPLLKHMAFLDADRLEHLLGHWAAFVDRFERQVIYEARAVYVALQAKRVNSDGTEEMLVYASARHQTPIWRLVGVELSDDIVNWLAGHHQSTFSQIAGSCATVQEPPSRPSTSLSPARTLLPMQRFLIELGAALDGVKDLVDASWPGCVSSFRLGATEEMRIGGRRRATIIVLTGTLGDAVGDSTPTTYSPFVGPIDLHGHAFSPVASFEPAHILHLDGDAARQFGIDQRADLKRIFPTEPVRASIHRDDVEKGTPDIEKADFIVTKLSPVAPVSTGSPISVLRSSFRGSRCLSPDLVPLSPMPSRTSSYSH